MTHYIFAFRRTVTLLTVCAVLALALILAGPQSAAPVEALCMPLPATLSMSRANLHADGRLNQIAHFGGDALYCLNADGQPTNDYDALDAFMLLDQFGQPLWSVSATDVFEAVAAAETSGEDQLIATEAGTHGPALLSVIETSDPPTFMFSATDEHGKLNTFEFTGCLPVGPAVQPAAANNEPQAAPPQCFERMLDGCSWVWYQVDCATAQFCTLDEADFNGNGSTTDYICNLLA